MNPNQPDPSNEAGLEGHDYDGIRELDNPAPFWWQLMFYASIVFAIGYVWHYTVGGGPSIERELQVALQDLELKQIQASSAGGVDANRLIAMVKEPASIKPGKETFKAKCAACHGPDGQGLIGPNLTDDHWLHGDGKVTSIFQVVDKGVPEKGMPPWGAMMKPIEVMQVSAYVKTLRGTKPANPKPPQGEAHPE